MQIFATGRGNAGGGEAARRASGGDVAGIATDGRCRVTVRPDSNGTAGVRPAGVPAYYLGRPAHVWLAVFRPKYMAPQEKQRLTYQHGLVKEPTSPGEPE